MPVRTRHANAVIANAPRPLLVVICAMFPDSIHTASGPPPAASSDPIRRPRPRGHKTLRSRILSIPHRDDQPVAQVEAERARRGEQSDLQGRLSADQAGGRWNEE